MPSPRGPLPSDPEPARDRFPGRGAPGRGVCARLVAQRCVVRLEESLPPSRGHVGPVLGDDVVAAQNVSDDLLLSDLGEVMRSVQNTAARESGFHTVDAPSGTKAPPAALFESSGPHPIARCKTPVGANVLASNPSIQP